MRGNRSRRTADKLASYKAAASRDSIRNKKDLSRPVPSRVSPRRKNAASESGSGDLSPTKTSGIVKRTVRKGAEKLSHIKKGNKNEEEMALGSLVESDNESEKPSKKRKIFTTPPRVPEKEDGSLLNKDTKHLPISQHLDNIASCILSGDESKVPETDEEEGSGDIDRNCGDPRSGAHANDDPRCLAGSQKPAQGTGYLNTPVRAENAERSAVRTNELELLSLSSATLSRMLDGYGKEIASEMELLQHKSVCEMRKIAENVLSAVAGEMRHMEGVFSMMTRGMGGVRSTKNGLKKSLTEWEQKLNSLTPDTELIFNREVLGMLLCFNTPIQASIVYRKQAGTDVEKAVLSAQTLLFSLQPGDKKFSYSGKVGGLHSEFKFTVVQNAFFNVLRDTFKMFQMPNSSKNIRTDNSSSDTSASLGTVKNGEGSSVSCKQIKRPSWLREKLRRTTSMRPAISLNGQTSYEKASYLHVRRGAVRSAFFQSIGYLLVPWHQFVKDVSQNTLKMSWASEASKDDDGYLSLDLVDVPCSEQSGFVTDHRAVTSIDAKNKTLLRQLFEDWPGMVLIVEHNVFVVNGNGAQRRHSGGNPMNIRRLFNLIDVACDFCVEYCGASSRETFLRAHKYSLRCIMIFAILFKAFFVKFKQESPVQESSSASNVMEEPRKFPEPSELDVEGFSLKDIIPGPSTQKNLLECRCLRMTQSEFNMYNHNAVEDNQALDGDGGEGPVLDMIDIEESEELGIGVL